MTNVNILGTHGKIGSHVHFEALNDLGKVIENLHLPVVRDAPACNSPERDRENHAPSGRPTKGSIEVTKVPDSKTVEVVEQEGAFYLLRLDEKGECIAGYMARNQRGRQVAGQLRIWNRRG